MTNTHAAYKFALFTLHAMQRGTREVLPHDLWLSIFSCPTEYAKRLQLVSEFPEEFGGSAAKNTVETMLNARESVRDFRAHRQSGRAPQSRVEQCYENIRTAGHLVRGVSPMDKKDQLIDIAPAIYCKKGMPSTITENGGRGRVYLPVHWHLSVLRHGIGVCSFGDSHVLVVRARQQPSVFLAEMGIRYYEVDGLKLGKVGRRVTGYAFAADGCMGIFANTFTAGAAAMKRRLADVAFHAMDV